MTNPTMSDIYHAAKTAASRTYAAGWYALARAYTTAQALAAEALEAEKVEYEATLALFSCFPSEEAEQDALQAETQAISAASWARMAAWTAWEEAQAAFHAEEAEEIREYEARCAAYEATLAEAEEAAALEEEEGWGDIAIEAWLRDLSAGDRDFLCGEEDPVTIAREWYSQGFTPASMQEWAFRARCFRPEAARALTILGLNPEDCRVLGPQGDTVGHACANGDLDALAAAALVLQG